MASTQPPPGPSQDGAAVPSRAQIRRWRKHLAEERMEARTYRDLSERRTGEERAVLLQLEEAERRHEEYWLARLGENALPAPPVQAGPSRRVVEQQQEQVLGDLGHR